MKNTPTTFGSILLMITIVSSPVFAQSYRDWSKPEQRLADILVRDTTSSTVSYLPKGYWFGLSDRSYGYLKLVKNGARNYLLRDGTHEVYLLRKDQNNIFLDRQDSSVFYGDNFLSMTFLRKDTIYQYGGYGFWNTRDFFMYYRSTNQDWEFLSGGQGLPNELNYHWYDEREDAFYIMGSLYSIHHPVPQKKLVDSIYRYDFATRHWSGIGRVPDNFSELNLLWKLELTVCFTPFGFFDTRTFQLKLYDIPGNKILTPRGRLTDFVLRAAKGNPIQLNEFKHFIYLKDSLHIIQGNKDTVFHASIQVTKKDFDASNPQTLFIPNDEGFSMALLPNMTWMLSLGIPLSIAGVFWTVRKRRKNQQEQVPDEDATVFENVDETTQTDQPDVTSETVGESTLQDIAFFKAQLNPTELALLDLLLSVTQNGTSADITAINKTLGVLSKDVSLQKARRSISINNINSCFRQILKKEENLIIRERDDDDKRAFVYKLNPRFIDRLS